MKNIHELPPKLSYVSLAFGLLIVILSVVFLLVGNANAFTEHRFVVNESESGVLSIDSFPEKMNNIPTPNYPHLLVCFVKEHGRWNDKSFVAGKQNCLDEKIYNAYIKIKSLMRALDKIVPNYHGIVSFSYILCYHDSVIFFEKDYSYDKMCLIAEKLNIERRNN